MFFLNIVPSWLYLIKKILPERGFLGPFKFITSERDPSIGISTIPVFSILPETFTFINFGDKPLSTDFGRISRSLFFNLGIKIESPSNKRISFLSSPWSRKDLKLMVAFFLPPPFSIGISLTIFILDKSLYEVKPAFWMAFERVVRK